MTGVAVGDRLRLVSMPQEPDPLPVGSEGTVDYVHDVSLGVRCTQIGVKWDNGRTLMLCVPPDRFVVIDQQVPK